MPSFFSIRPSLGKARAAVVAGSTVPHGQDRVCLANSFVKSEHLCHLCCKIKPRPDKLCIAFSLFEIFLILKNCRRRLKVFCINCLVTIEHIEHFTVDSTSFAYLQPLPKSPKSIRWGRLSPLAQRTAVRSYLVLMEERGTPAAFKQLSSKNGWGNKRKVAEIGGFNLVPGFIWFHHQTHWCSGCSSPDFNGPQSY